jgi:biopolymer transport protein ExbB
MILKWWSAKIRSPANRVFTETMMYILRVAATLALFFPFCSNAWWNPDWTARKKIVLDTAAAGVQQAASNVPVLVRLHTGNFPFADADMDGKDLRFVAGDDKTPLRFHVEQFDGVNELALVWVQVPKLEAASKENAIWLYYGNPKVPAASDPKGSYDAAQTLVLHFNAANGAFTDATQYGHTPTVEATARSTAGVADGGAVFSGRSRLSWGGVPALKIGASGFTWSAWVKPAEAAQSAALFSQTEGIAAVQVFYDQGKVLARAFGAETAKVDLAPGAWRHVAITLSDRLVLYVDGREAGSANVRAAELGGEIAVGTNFKGDLDELQLSSVARAGSWLLAQVASQSETGNLVRVGEPEAEGGGESASYFAILLSAVTLDGWIVIGILMVMMVLSFWVMFAKGVFLARTDRANRRFQTQFERMNGREVAEVDPARGVMGSLAASSLYRLFSIGAAQLRQRVSQGQATLNPQAIDAIRASLDAGIVRENARLNSQMVLLTIAISGGPFLGLLGTVVGVMITFAAIAAVGDVNVNSIAPGIAAALVATVAGLAVAIPALFGYNYLASRVKNISADQQVFADELIAKIAESYS